MVVGDGKPFIAALITLDAESLPGWLEQQGTARGHPGGDPADDPAVIGEIQGAVDNANKAVSHAEAIKKFRSCPRTGPRRAASSPLTEAEAQRGDVGVRRRGVRTVRLSRRPSARMAFGNRATRVLQRRDQSAPASTRSAWVSWWSKSGGRAGP